MQEKRNLVRKSLIYHLQVMNTKTRRLVGYVGNITREGLLLFSPEPIPGAEQATLPLALICPQPIEGIRRVVFRGRKVWSAPDAHLGMHANGFHIERINVRNLKLLQTLIEQYAAHG
jgi:hypothetical protein